MIPQTNPKANYLKHKAEIDAAALRVLEGGWYILGSEVKAFEEEFARFIGVGFGIGNANGTDSIELALRAAGCECGDIVFAVGHTAVATAVGIERAGCVPVLVDIDPARYTMCPNSLEAAVKAAKKDHAKHRPFAIVCVHLYGQPADLGAMMDIAARHDLKLIEDCAQCHGATYKGKITGSFGVAAAFSLYPTKNLGAMGDGGITVTNDPGIADRAKQLREYGWKERYVSSIAGCNSRLDELHAGMLRAKLKHLDADNAGRIEVARQYHAGLTIKTKPWVAADVKHVYHQYVIRVKDRTNLQAQLKEAGVGTLVHYPVPVHMQPAYHRLPRLVPMTHTEQAAREVLSLPMYGELTAEQVQSVIAQVNRLAEPA